MNNSTLKHLQTRLKEVEIDLSIAKSEVSRWNKEVSSLIGSKFHITKEIETLTKKDIIVSEHAILRYLERVDGVDIEAIKRLILNDGVVSIIEKLDRNNGEYPSNDKWKFTLVLRNGIVTTIKTKQSGNNNT